MDKRQTTERRRANGSGKFSPATRRPLRRSLSKIGKPHAACGSSLPTPHPTKTRKPHAACGYALLLAALPLAALAADAEGSRVITLDVAGGGVLGGLCTAIVMWLNNQRKQQQQPRTPPLGEDVARTYATKDELTHCRTSCRKDIDDIRAKIDDNDKKAEDRARGTHARIDALYRESQKMTKSLGMLIGIMVGKGIAPASTALTNETGE